MKWRAEAIKLSVLAAIIALIVAFCDTRAILDSVRRAGPMAVALGFVLSIVVITLSSFKWQLILPTAHVWRLFKIVLISSFYSYFLFGQASGEAMKMYLLSRASGKTGGTVISVIADRLTSSIGLLIVSIAGFGLSPSPYPDVLQSMSVAGLTMLLGLLIALRHDAALSLGERLVCWIERAARRFKNVAEGLRQAIEQWHMSVRNVRLVAATVTMGGLIHIGNALVIFVMSRGVGIEVSFFDWCWIAGVMSIAGLVPITVGQVTSHGTMVALLQLLGVPLADALAVSVLVMAVSLLVALIGAFLEWRRWRKMPL
jgi:uncharacterized protein (TIRG00374 family)